MSQGNPPAAPVAGQPRPQPRVPRSRTQSGQGSTTLPPPVTPSTTLTPSHPHTLPPQPTPTQVLPRRQATPISVPQEPTANRQIFKQESFGEEDLYSDDSITLQNAIATAQCLDGQTDACLDAQTVVGGAADLSREREELRQRESAVAKREQEVYLRETAVSDKEYHQKNKEVELIHKEDELHVKKKDLARKEFELEMEEGGGGGRANSDPTTSSRMAEIADKELELQRREADMNQRESNWTASLNARENQLLSRGEELERREFDLEQRIRHFEDQKAAWDSRPQPRAVNQTQQWDSRPQAPAQGGQWNYTAPQQQSQTRPRNFSTSSSESAGYPSQQQQQQQPRYYPPPSQNEPAMAAATALPYSSSPLQPGFASSQGEQQQPGYPNPTTTTRPSPQKMQPGSFAYPNQGPANPAQFGAPTGYPHEPQPPFNATPYAQEPQFQGQNAMAFVPSQMDPPPPPPPQPSSNQFPPQQQQQQQPYNSPAQQHQAALYQHQLGGPPYHPSPSHPHQTDTGPPGNYPDDDVSQSATGGQVRFHPSTSQQSFGSQVSMSRSESAGSTALGQGAISRGQSSDSVEGNRLQVSPQKKSIDADAELAISLSQDRDSELSQQISEDERLARELQEEEERQARALMGTVADAQLALQLQKDLLETGLEMNPAPAQQLPEGAEGGVAAAGEGDVTRRIQQALLQQMDKQQGRATQEEEDRKMAERLRQEAEGAGGDIPPEERNDLNI